MDTTEAIKLLAEEIQGLRSDLQVRDRRCAVRGETIAVLVSKQADIISQLNNRRKAAVGFVLGTLSHVIAAIGAAAVAVYLIT